MLSIQMHSEVVGALAALLTMFGFVPQIIKIVKTRSVNDVSLLMLVQYSAGIILWLVYGVLINDRILIIANIVTLSTLAVAIGLYLRYRSS
jgi:MtN3 and saliva related transmembrane protein